MATTKNTKARRSADRASRPTPDSGSRPQDAIGLLEADHREVDAMFEQFESLQSDADKLTLAGQICVALKVHTQIEEELFYPKAREATGDTDLLDEATVEHMSAKALIAEIEAMRPGQPLYDAKVKVLGEQVRQHVREEEEELFPQMRETRVDLDALGAKLAARKAQLAALLTPVAVGEPA